jgi:DnaJ like chaperone protein
VLGKLFGGAFGFMFGGPLGALVGAMVGHNLDQGQRKTPPAVDLASNDERMRAVFLATAFQVLGHLAKADGRVSESEIAATRTLMTHLRLNAGQQQTAIVCFNEGKQPDFAVDAALENFQRVCRRHPALLQQLLELFLHIAYADGDLHSQTHARLLYVAAGLGVPRLQFEALHAMFRAQRWAHQRQQGGDGGEGRERSRPTTAVNSLAEAYSILGLKRDASPEDIKLAYRRLIRQHHPDKRAASGASPTELARATERTRELTAAYERIREARGF